MAGPEEPFWATALKGTKSFRTHGTFVRWSVRPPKALSGLKSALSGLKSAFSGLFFQFYSQKEVTLFVPEDHELGIILFSRFKSVNGFFF